MAFVCRICKSKFLVASVIVEDVDSPIVSTICGHLFHRKCLEASVTNRRLSHAMTGTGPFRRYCPAFGCGNELAENGIIDISTTREPRNLDKEEALEEDEDMEVKLTKKFQYLTSEKDRLAASLEKLELENESYREALDEIKTECEDMSSLLVDDNLINKGDKVFWITKEGTLSPGKIQEMRKKAGQDLPYAVIKLERKIKLPGQGPFKSERDMAIVSVEELLTFKSFFKEMFEEFRHKLWKILSDANQSKTLDGRQRLLRTKFRESSLRLSMDYGNLEGSFSSSHEAVNSIPAEALKDYKERLLGEKIEPKKRAAQITRSKTVHFGMTRPRPRTIDEKTRSVSVNRTSPLSDSDFSFDSDGSALQSPILTLCPTFANEDTEEAVLTEYIAVGERVIWYDTYSESPQVGEIASLLEYTPCAIVKFDKLPNETKLLQFRTVPVDQLFPYDLASPEEKLRIAEAYGIIDEFMESHPEIFEEDELDFEGGQIEDEEYFSTSSAEDIIICETIHEV